MSAATLIRACHPGPCLAVATLAALLAVSAGTSDATAALVGVAVLTGQLSIGWSNDRMDATADRAVGRLDKPLARGDLTIRAVDQAVALALAATVATSLALGWRAGLVHLAGVGCGWLYNAALKATVWSWLPYAVGFGTLPAVATLALPSHPAPAAWAVAAAALLGVVGNLTNSLPDLDSDRTVDVRGLPHRLGARGSVLVATVLLVAAALLIVFGPPGAPSGLDIAALVVDVVAAVGGLSWAWAHSASRAAFIGVIVVAGIDVVLLAAGGGLR